MGEREAGGGAAAPGAQVHGEEPRRPQRVLQRWAEVQQRQPVVGEMQKVGVQPAELQRMWRSGNAANAPLK